MLHLFAAATFPCSAKAASAAGFGIGIVDDRKTFRERRALPMASTIHTAMKTLSPRFIPARPNYLLIVTRGHKEDMRVLAWAVRTEARYIGMIGSKRKVLSVYKAWETTAISLKSSNASFAPMAWNRRAFAEEIAVSIVAE